VTQLAKNLKVDLRVAQTHPAARDRIEHPRGHHDDVPGIGLDVNELARGAHLAVVAANSTTVEWMPAILDHDGLPDMGRMTVRLPSGGRITTGAGPSAASGSRRSSTRSSSQPSWPGWSRGRIWARSPGGPSAPPEP
jgi:hypothetical protein